MHLLEHIQQDFVNAFYHHDEEAFVRHIAADKRLSAQRRFQIYQNSIIEGLAIHLRGLYQACEKVVGDDFFTHMAYQYIKQNPCYSADLNQYGQTFADFVSTFEPAQSLPYLTDLSHLCWHFHMAMQTQTYTTFDINAFSDVLNQNSDDIVLTLQPSIHLLSSDYPLDQIWQLCCGENDEEIDLTSGGVYLMTWYDGTQVRIDNLTPAQWQVAQWISEKKSLSALERACQDQHIDLSALLPRFLQQGWLAGWV